MKYTVNQIKEIIDSNGELIGSDAVPDTGANMETKADKTTDYNVGISHQPFKYDMLGRFGFTMLPFFEGEDGASNMDNDIINEIGAYLYKHYLGMMKEYYKNPKKLQSEYRKKSNMDFDPDGIGKHEIGMAKDILGILEPYLDKSLNELNDMLKEKLDESSFIEGKVIENKTDREFSKKASDNDVLDSKLKKIVGLINKMDKSNIKKIKDLLETE